MSKLNHLYKAAKEMHAKKDKYWLVVAADDLSDSDLDTVLNYRNRANPEVVLKLLDVVGAAEQFYYEWASGEDLVASRNKLEQALARLQDE